MRQMSQKKRKKKPHTYHAMRKKRNNEALSLFYLFAFLSLFLSPFPAFFLMFLKTKQFGETITSTSSVDPFEAFNVAKNESPTKQEQEP